MFIDLDRSLIEWKNVARLVGGTLSARYYTIGGGTYCYLTPDNVRVSAYYLDGELHRFRFWISGKDFSIDYNTSEVFAENFVKVRRDGFVSLSDLRMKYNEISKIARDLLKEKVVALNRKRAIRESAENLTTEIALHRFSVSRRSSCGLSGKLYVGDFRVDYTCYVESEFVHDVVKMLLSSAPFVFEGPYSSFEVNTHDKPEVHRMSFKFETPDIGLIRKFGTLVKCFPTIHDAETLKRAYFYF